MSCHVMCPIAAGDIERAIETVKAMQEEGLAPDIITYTSLIKVNEQ